MFRKQISPKFTAIAVLLILGGIQFVYWRLLVYSPPSPPGPGGGGGGGGPVHPTALGRADVEVQTLTGEGAGFHDGALWEARFSGPNALAVGAGQVVFVADSRNHRIRAISPQGQVTTVAGGGEADGVGGRAEGAALSARFSYPSGIAVDPAGTLYVADTGNHRICRVKEGQVTAWAGGAEGGTDGVGSAARFRYPAALALDDGGALWVADAGNRRVRKIDAAGQVSSPADVPHAIRYRLGEIGTAGEHAALVASEDGELDTGPTPFTVGRRSSSGMALAQAQLVADTERRVLLLCKAGEPAMLLAGRVSDEAPDRRGTTDGDGRRASFILPCALAPAPDGNAYVADYAGNVIRKVLLPEWVRRGEAAPVGRRRRQWRVGSGS